MQRIVLFTNISFLKHKIKQEKKMLCLFVYIKNRERDADDA